MNSTTKIIMPQPKTEESLLVRAFAELMPEVEFVDVTPKAGGTRQKLENRLGRPIVSRKNYLKDHSHKKLGVK